MAITANTLRPGLLVSLKTSVTGGVEYQRVDIETGKPLTTGAKVDRWETTKIVQDPAEYEAAIKLRSKCRSIVARCCVESEFGLLCPTTREAELEAAIIEARGMAVAFNTTSKLSTVGVYMITGRVAQDDAEAVKALSKELDGLFDTMERGVKAADPEAIRKAAAQAKNLGDMLSDSAKGKVDEAVKQAREAAKVIIKRVAKGGEEAAAVAEKIQLDKVKAARFAFLDLAGEKGAAPVTQRGLDLDLGSTAPAPEKAAAQVPAISLDPPAVPEAAKAAVASGLSAWELL